MQYLTEFILLTVLIALSAFSAAAEIALVSLSRFRLRTLLEKGMPGAHYVKKLKEDPRRLLTTILITNNLVNTAAAALATGIAFKTFESNAIAIATGVMTFLLVIFGDLIPKSIAVRHSVPLALFFGPPVWFLSVVLLPIVKLSQMFLKLVDNILGTNKNQPTMTEDELKSIVQMGEEEGAINELERIMIHRIFEFDDIPLSEVMTPKAEMVTVSAQSKIRDVLALNSKKQFSRLPVYEKSRDNIVGVLHIKDMMPALKGNKSSMIVEKIMRKPLFVPEVKKLDSLLRLFQKSKEHLAIVVNEHGSITGLITIEDVLEEIVGDIMDETDRAEPGIVKLSKKSWLVKGKAQIDELNEKLKMHIEESEAGTLNGLIHEITGKIPKEGDEIEYGKFQINIQRMEGHRVAVARVSRK